MTLNATSTTSDVIFLGGPSGSAEAADFSLTSVVLPAGLPAGTHTIGLIDKSIAGSSLKITGGLDINDDAKIEGPEAVTFQILPIGYAVTSAFHAHTIIDEEVAIVELDANVNEGATSFGITLKQTDGDAGATLEDTLPITIEEVSATATDPDDYTYTKQAVTFVAGVPAGTSIPVAFPTVDDSLAEPDESVTFKLTDGVSAAGDSYKPSTPGVANYIASGNKTVTIKDNEMVTIGFDRPSDMVWEDDPTGDTRVDVGMVIIGSGTAPFKLQDDLFVPVNIAGTATNMLDFALIAPNLVTDPNPPFTAQGLLFPATSTNVITEFYIETESGGSVAPAVTDDAILEGDENALFTLDTSGNIATLGGPGSGTFDLLIKDDEVGTMTITKTDGDEDGNVPVTFTVKVEAPLTGPGAPTAIDLSSSPLAYTLGGTALDPQDRGPGAPDPLPFTPVICTTTCSTTATITVPVVDDTVLEPTETVIATFSGFLTAASIANHFGEYPRR